MFFARFSPREQQFSAAYFVSHDEPRRMMIYIDGIFLVSDQEKSRGIQYQYTFKVYRPCVEQPYTYMI